MNNMLKLDTLLEDGLRSDLTLQLHIKALRETLKQQLQETERIQTEELEKRIHQNACLSADADKKTSGNKKHLTECDRMVTSASAIRNASHKPVQSERPNTSTDRKQCSRRTQLCERFALTKTLQLSKEEEAEAECQKKFSALPLPSHVIQPIYQEMMEQREKERKEGLEQRKQFLLSIQKPFSFQEREKEKREKLIAKLNQVLHVINDVRVRKAPQKEIKDSPDSSETKDREQVCPKLHTQAAVREENPTRNGPKLRTAERTRKEKLGFLDEKPSFQPKIIHQVPDFSALHKALQTEALLKMQSKDITKCQPFFLRTSARPARQSRMSPANSQIPKTSNFSRSKSLGALTLISTDTLPTYITDAVRKRCMATRKSIEMRDNKNQDSVDWLRNYQMRSQAMKKTITLHAKLLDPHSSLKEVYNEKLQLHREADQQRMRDYTRELREIKARVNERPFLFEQVKQRNAKAQAEQTYRSKLKKAGLKEQFVEENGEALTSEDDRSIEKDIDRREENGGDGEKIEAVEEKSVKSKGEAVP
ncbi:protein FAM161B [Archocentrus centrarchus]|uniref:protein FAM161B n=1 Tax=Archocentrus centrarchus TaxID=63155 RepID=UPI0011EA3674|nr:protein FAM161B [Archocentrus centrarchus]